LVVALMAGAFSLGRAGASVGVAPLRAGRWRCPYGLATSGYPCRGPSCSRPPL
ncbi:hypothetical protein GW17_00056186, partial [Ensete ventricosum]